MKKKENKIVVDIVQDNNNRIHALLPEISTYRTPRKEMTKAPIPEEASAGYEHAPWGKSDSLPTIIREKIEKVPIAGAAISKQIAMMFGNGLCYYRNQDLQNGNTKIQRAYIPEVEAWLKKNRIINKWVLPQLADYRYYLNTFSEIILSGNADLITGLYHKPAEFCRLSVQNEKTLHIDEVLYSPDFAFRLPPEDDRVKRIPLFRWYDEEGFLQKLKGRKFAWHSKFETPGTIYYARPFWLALFRENGWLDVSTAVPEVVNAMMQNQIVLKYQILIPETYFQMRYQDWDNYTDQKKQEQIKALIDKINGSLAGTDNAFKSISTVFKQDPTTGADLGKIEIIAIDDKVKKDAWVPSSEKADAQIVQGLGLHPSQVGLAPEGGKMGAGSGSDQRESFNTSISLNTMDQEIVLEPLNYVAQYNARKNANWDITFCFDHTYHTTTNNQENGLDPTDTTIQVQ